MRQERTFAHVAASGFAMVIFLGGSAVWLWGDRLPAMRLSESLTLAIGFCLASLVGSRVAWQLRLPDTLGPLASVAFWAVFLLVMCAVPLIAVRLSATWGLWVFWIWAILGSYTWGFLQLNTRLPRQYSG